MSPSVMDIIGIAAVSMFAVKCSKSSTGIIGVILVGFFFYGILKAAIIGVGWGFTRQAIENDIAQYVSGAVSIVIWFLILMGIPWLRARRRLDQGKNFGKLGS